MKPVVVNNVVAPVEKRGFKRKTIIENITRKIDLWLKSISDENLRNKVRNSYIVTGGAIASMLLGDLPNDYDIYLQDVDVALELAEYYLKGFREKNQNYKIKSICAKPHNEGVSIFIKSAGVITNAENMNDYDYFEGDSDSSRLESYLDKESFKEKKHYSVAMITSNAISLHGDIQIILRFVGNPSVIHENYDFVHVKNYYTSNDGLVLNPESLEAILSKSLKYVGSKYPICSMFRIKKFLKRGWTITAGEILKIAFDINKLDLENMKVFYDQLIGVDAAYFNQLIRILKSKEKEGLDRSFLFQSIEKVFDESDIDHDEEDFNHITGEN